VSNVVVTVDPGINAVGWCAWDSVRFHSEEFTCPVSAGVIRGNMKLQPHDRIVDLAENCVSLFQVLKIVDGLVENPTMFGGGKGFAAARKGDLGRLHYFVGVLVGMHWGKGVPFELVPVTTWIGNLPKEVMRRRVSMVLTRERCKFKLSTKNSHDWDACGVGLWKQGVL